jgi:hypothetical protein
MIFVVETPPTAEFLALAGAIELTFLGGRNAPSAVAPIYRLRAGTPLPGTELTRPSPGCRVPRCPAIEEGCLGDVFLNPA